MAAYMAIIKGKCVDYDNICNAENGYGTGLAGPY